MALSPIFRALRVPSFFAFMVLGIVHYSPLVFAQKPTPSLPSSSSPTLWRFGLFGQAGWSQHTAQFLGSASAVYPQDPYFNDLVPMRLVSNPFSWNAGILAEAPVWEGESYALGIAARVGIHSLAATFSSSLAIPIDASPVPNGNLNFTFQTNALFLNAEPLIQWRFADKRAVLMAGAGFRTVYRDTSSQSRTLTSSQPISDALRQRSEGTESAPLAGTTFGRVITTALIAGIAWEIPITSSGSLLLAPEVFYSFGLNNITPNILPPNTSSNGANTAAMWRMSTLRAGISLKFAPEKPAPPIEQNIERKADIPDPPKPAPVLVSTTENANNKPTNDTTTTKPTTAQTDVRVRIASLLGVEADGRITENPTLHVEEFLASSSRFLIPYVFFEEGSFALPMRYKRLSAQERKAFAPEEIIKSTLTKDHELDAYYHLLNIVGFRMRKYAAAQLVLTGFSDVVKESVNKTLPLRRAEVIKAYLRDTWGIAEERITTKSGGARGLSDVIDAEENRVVEMQASQPEIFNELRYEYTLRTVKPATLEITPEIAAPKGLAAWSLNIDEDSAPPAGATEESPRTLTSYEGRIVPGVIRSSLQRFYADTLPKSDSLRITLTGRDNATFVGRDVKALPLEYTSLAEKKRRNAPDVRIGTYWVFCFNLNSKQILVDERVQSAVKSIKSLILPGASVNISGYSDTRGNIEKNRKLSDERAEAVLQLIGLPLSKAGSVEGKGESVFYDNDLPEGRFYNRFVRVDVRTPVRPK